MPVVVCFAWGEDVRLACSRELCMASLVHVSFHNRRHWKIPVACIASTGEKLTSLFQEDESSPMVLEFDQKEGLEWACFNFEEVNGERGF